MLLIYKCIIEEQTTTVRETHAHTKMNETEKRINPTCNKNQNWEDQQA